VKRQVTAICLLVAFLPGIVRAQDPPAKPSVVPFELLLTKHMAVQIKVNGKGPYRVIFDTGAPVTLLSTKIGKETGLMGKDGKGLGFSLFGPVGQGKIQTLEVGNLKAEGVSALVMDHPTVNVMSSIFGPIEGIVGFPFFARYRMTLDYQKQEMTFVPNGYDPPDVMQALMATVMGLQRTKPEPKVILPAAQWGMTLHKADDDDEPGVTIQEVFADTAAAQAGLKKGDRLLSLDGRWTDTVADSFVAAGHVKPGTAAGVVIRRDGKEIELSVKPRAGL
jgi:hypothetical protein